MVKTTLQKIILALNLGCLACYGLAALVVLAPLRELLRASGFFAGYEIIALFFLGLGIAGLLAQIAGVLSIVHLVRSKRWSWDLALSILTWFVIPSALTAWFRLGA
jgi:hypothetical protein